ncbi:MAG: inositol monophosphatase [Leptospirales bacterium]|nr:inositol monophosphatase [Leptospirales bacterium]
MAMLEEDIRSAARVRLSTALAAAPAAEALLRDLQYGDLEVRSKSTASDLVTRADLESEQALLGAIRRDWPNDAILAEESGRSGGAQGDFSWAVDPLDGTVNYAHGLPLYSISIGILYNNSPIAGLVCLPALNRRYHGLIGEGAFRDQRPIHVSDNRSLADALVVTGFPYERAAFLDSLVSGVRSVLASARGIRRTGSAAIDLCWVAEGSFDAHYEFNLGAWDVAAGAAIVRAAGGRVSDFSGKNFEPGMFQMLATNGLIHAPMLETLAPLASIQSLPGMRRSKP